MLEVGWCAFLYFCHNGPLMSKRCPSSALLSMFPLPRANIPLRPHPPTRNIPHCSSRKEILRET